MKDFKYLNQDLNNVFEGITDIEDAIEQLKISEEERQKLISIIEGTNLGTWEWDIKTNAVKANKQLASILGYTLEELEPINIKTWEKFTHPEDLRIAMRVLEEHLNDNIKCYEYELRVQHKDGHWIWVHDKGKVTERDENGKPTKMLGTHSDITLRKQAEERLKESEKRFLLALNATEAGLWDIDMINKTIFLAPMWKSILGYENYEIDNSFEAWSKLWHPEDRDYIIKALNNYLEDSSKSYNLIHRLKHKDGSWRWILSRGGILKNDNGNPYRWIGTHIDITTQQEQSLEIERFFTISLDLLCIFDMEGQVLKTNDAWEDILGYTMDELDGYNAIDLIHKDDIEDTASAFRSIQNGGSFIYLINRYINKDGIYRYIEWRANSYEDLVYASGRDITERIEYEEKILEMSNRDYLTNAYNRRHIFDRGKEILEEFKRDGKVFSVCIIDIDNFKDINDNYGHQVGDSILKIFTEIIDENLRPYDLLGRYGGEEFILILNNADKEKSKLVIKRILNIIRDKTFVFNEQNIKFTFTAGISDCTEMINDKLIIDELINIADQRMYHAKNTGKNKVVLKI